MKTLMIYGAVGYTGRMIAREARAAGLDVLLAGRDEARLSALASELDAPYRMFTLDGNVPTTNLAGIHTVLNCAGPFVNTAAALMHACLRAGANYLDIAAEIGVYQLAESLSDAAKEAGIMLMPGVGWDVVPTDCLGMQVAERVIDPTQLRFALKVAGPMSRGSAVSAAEIMGAGVLVRMDGELVARSDAPPALFDFGEGPVECIPLSFGDLVTAPHSTGVGNIAMYVHVAGDAFPEGDVSLLPEGPTHAQRLAHRASAIAEATGADGSVATAIIETINGYSYTPLVAVAAAKRVVAGEAKPGFETPARVFGSNFAETIPGSKVTHLASSGCQALFPG